MASTVLLQTAIYLTSIHCYKCGVIFGMDQEFYKKRKEDGAEWFCPNGHGQVFRDSEVTVLQKQLDETKARLDAEKARHNFTKNEAEAQRNRAERLDKKLKRTTKRVANGVCPCCNRSFENLQRHMTTKHPDFKEKA